MGAYALRRRLSYITNHLPVDIHAIAIQSLQSKWHHSVVCFIHSRFERVNCVKFAFLDLDWNLPAEEDSPQKSAFITTQLVKILIDHRVLKKTWSRRADYAVYYRKKQITHIGVMRKNRKILSKWGKGLVYEHAPSEVPVNYGKPVFYRHAVNKHYTYQKAALALKAYFS